MAPKGAKKRKLDKGDEVGDRQSDLAELDRFRHAVPYVSKSALEAIIKEGKKKGLPKLDTRQAMTEASQIQMDQTTDYGPLMNTIDLEPLEPGLPIRLNVLNPISYLCILLMASVGFSQLVERTYDANPCTMDKPWRLALYSDEVTPGDAFSVTLARKVQVVYWSFLEFEHLLSDENTWMIATAKRSSEVAKVSGQMSQVMGQVAKLFVYGDSSFDGSGIWVKLATGRKIRLFAKIGMFIQDGGAHKATFHCKGDSGSRFCMLCRNVFSLKSELGGDVDEDGDSYSSIIKVADLDFAESEEIIESLERVHHFRTIDTAKDFEKRCIANGFSYSGYNLLLDPDLRDHLDPKDQFCHDWMHCLFQSGVWNIVTFLVLAALAKNGFRNVYAHLHDWLSDWHGPAKFKMQKPWQYFAKTRETSNKDAKKFKCPASAGLSLCAVLGVYFAIHAAAGRCLEEIDVYVSLVDLVEYFLAANRHTVTAKGIRKAVENFLAKFCRVFGYKKQTPKFHWLLHFARHYRIFKMLVSCFVHERKHRVLKRYCQNVLNTVVFEVSVLAEVL